MQEINSNLMQSIIKQDEPAFLRDGNYFSRDGVAFTGLNVEHGQITHTRVSTIEEIEQWFKEKDLKLQEIMKKHAKDLTEEEHDMVFSSLGMATREELEENMQNSKNTIRLTADEIDELADLAMRTPNMSKMLRSKLFVGTEAIREDPLQRMLRRLMSQGML